MRSQVSYLTLPRGLQPRADRAGHAWWRLFCLAGMGIAFLMAALPCGSAGTAKPAVITRVEAAATAEGLDVEVVTTAYRRPVFQLLSLRNPDRLILEIEGVRVKRGIATSISVDRAGVKRIRVGQYQSDPPISRIVFDLLVPLDRLQHRAIPSTDAGRLRIEFSEPGRAVRPEPPAAAIKEAPTVPPQPAEAPPSVAAPTETPAAPTPEPPAEVVRTEPVTPRPVGPASSAPRRRAPASPRGERGLLPQAPLVPWILGALVAVLIALGSRVRDYLRARGRHTRLRQGLGSEDSSERLRALEGLKSWSPREVQSIWEALLVVTRDSASDVAERAAEVLRRAFPLDDLIAQLGSGRSDSRGRAAELLTLYGAEAASEPLFEAALVGPPMVSRAAFESLVALARREPLRPVLLALSSEKEEEQSLSAEVMRGAEMRSARPLMKAVGDPDELVRCGVIDGLLLVAPEGSARAISGLLSDPLPRVRARAARALGLLGANTTFREPLLKALEDSSAQVQEAAALALAQLGGEQLDELVCALDRRTCEQPEVQFSEELLETIASRCTDPFPALESVLSSLNRGFAAGLARALEQSGRLDEWARDLSRVTSEERELLVRVLRKAAQAGATGPLLRGVETPDKKVQEECARLLGEAAEPAAVGPLVRLLSLPDEALRTAAAESLGRLGGDDAAARLIAALEDPSPAVREAAARGLAQCVGPVPAEEEVSEETEGPRSAATSGLMKALQDPAARVRAAAAATLGALGVQEAAPILVELALRDSDPATRAAAVDALGQMRAYDVLPLLMEVVNDPDPDLRGRAMQIFAGAGDSMAVEVLINALQDGNLTVRKTAARGLWEIATRGQVEILVPYLQSPDPKVRSAIAGVLGKVEAVEYAGALASAAPDPDPYARAAIVNAFCRLGEAAAYYIDVVVARLSDPDAFVRARAMEALAAMAPTNEGVARQFVPLTADSDASVRQAAGSCLIGFAEREVYAPLLELLSDAARRPQALEVLQAAEEAVLRKLLVAARSAAEESGSAAIETLCYVLSKRWTAKDFRPELDSFDPKVRLAGLEGLAMVGSHEAMEEVSRLLSSDPSPEVRRRAAQILAQSGNSVARAGLQKAAETDPDPEVRQAVAAMLGGAAPAEG